MHPDGLVEQLSQIKVILCLHQLLQIRQLGFLPDLGLLVLLHFHSELVVEIRQDES